MVPNKEVVLRSKIRIEGRQWLMARRDPKQWGDRSSMDVSANIMMLSPEERVQKALQLFDLMEKFVERARRPPMSDQPLVYDPGGGPAGVGCARPKERLRAELTVCSAPLANAGNVIRIPFGNLFPARVAVLGGTHPLQ